MNVSRRGVPDFRPALWPLVCVSIALAACSGDLSAQASRSQSPSNSPSPSIAMAPAEGAIRALPDFSPLVEKYGPAVVNVEVVEKAQQQNPLGGLSPNDPFYDFFRRFGIPAPEQGGPHNSPPVRGAGS